MIKKADNSDRNNIKSTAIKREIFIPINQKWLADFEYAKTVNFVALIWG